MTARLPTVVLWSAAALTLLAVAWSARSLPARFAGESGLPTPQAADPVATEAYAGVDSILAFAPFGQPVPRADAAPTAATPLRLALRGVVIADAPAESRAIVSAGSGPARPFAVGEEVAAGVSLDAVLHDHVVLLIGDRREILSFPERAAANEVPDEGEAGAASGVDALRALVVGGDTATAPSDEPAEGPADVAGVDAVIADFRARIRDDPQALLDALGLTASDTGYRVADTASPQLLSVGLKAGDLIGKVNGQQVGIIEQDRDLFDEVTGSGRARIELTRDGQPVVLTLPLKD